MPTRQNSQTANTLAPLKLTHANVSSMFGTLDLPVCDDGQLIEKKSADKKARYLALKTKPDPKGWAEADTWFANVVLMTTRRQDLLRLVYVALCLDFDTSIAAALASGQLTLSKQLVDLFKQKATANFGLEPSLANKFIEQYIAERNFKEGEAMLRPALVTQFSASSIVGKITLH